MSTPSDTPEFVRKVAEYWIERLSRPTRVKTCWQDEDGQWHEAVGTEPPPTDEETP